MKIDCPECGARVLADDLELSSKMAKCRACNAVFSFAEAARPAQAELARPRTRAPQPEGITVREESERAGEEGNEAPGGRSRRRVHGGLRAALGAPSCKGRETARA